ncbi:hypothetical protein [Staphylococcus hyicus]|uniref:Uncharacterized protein n=1 Tax=Staphylococcus hyicus TaxID=1284 RepID=A0ACD5FJL7_STAHY|nr:hypothetical protein [Staphylococcus hyicus]MCE5154195.1 hypothetical protein [Staphylococcus hyicus]MDP4460653.1 hypothetical protein [Staphylococcus hyicus]MDP4464160.1 hypothetical protein [Staphylococcus hyicus]MDY3697578.1 hypothetical protein [Staphylococcus hyicus]
MAFKLARNATKATKKTLEFLPDEVEDEAKEKVQNALLTTREKLKDFKEAGEKFQENIASSQGKSSKSKRKVKGVQDIKSVRNIKGVSNLKSYDDIKNIEDNQSLYTN